MSDHGKTSRSDAPEGRVFATTHWSVVLAAAGGTTEPAQRALQVLCTDYWYPIYVYVRRKGHEPEQAKELTQEFFAQLIAKEKLRLVDRTKGKFRSFLLAMLDYFLAREWSRAHRQKRGGHITFVPLSSEDPEERYSHEPADRETPERAFFRQWALTVLEQAMNLLETESRAAGKAPLFNAVKELLSMEQDSPAYADLGRQLSMGEGALRMAVMRLRRRYGELLREEVRRTVSDPGEVEAELRFLLGAVME